MRNLCAHCKRRRVRRSRNKYCRDCREELVGDVGKILLRRDDPFVIERNQRVERMAERAAQGLPIFESVHPDLS